MLAETADWDWEDLFQTANEEAVLPTISFALSNDLASLPPDVADFFSGVAELNRNRNGHIFRELKFAAQLLNGIGIQPVLLKGVAYLAANVYADPAARYLIDIDLLVSREQFGSAVEILRLNGFEYDDTDLFVQFGHHHRGLRRSGSVVIEVHRSLGLGPCASFLPANDVIQSSTQLEIDGIRLRLPCPEHLMAHLIMHSQMQHPYNERIWPPLRAMFDLVQLQRRLGACINWKKIEHRFRSAGQYGLLVLHLLDVRDALGFEPPFKARLTLLIRLRRLRRKALRSVPALRFLDPIYMVSVLFKRRMRAIKCVLSTPGGPKYLAMQMLRFSLYRRFLVDVLEGRGR